MLSQTLFQRRTRGLVALVDNRNEYFSSLVVVVHVLNAHDGHLVVTQLWALVDAVPIRPQAAFHAVAALLNSGIGSQLFWRLRLYVHRFIAIERSEEHTSELQS